MNLPNDEWIALAETLKPDLFRVQRMPRQIVHMEADPDAFQGWSPRDGGSPAALWERDLGRGDSVTLDFGEHLVGFLAFSVVSTGGFSDAPLRLKLIFGEVPAEVAEPFDPYPGELSRAWLQDETINIDVLPQTIRLPRRYAFRFLRIDVIDTSPEYGVRLTDIRCEAISSATFGPPPVSAPPLPNDLQILDEVSLRTLRNCMHTVFEDGPKRDRRLWLGDLRLQALANAVSFQNFDLVKRCLLLFAGLTDSQGLVPACVYEVPAPHRGHCEILDYAVLFGPTLLDYAQASGDWETARRLWPVARRQLDFGVQYLNPLGLFQDPGNWWIFIDWQADLDKQASMHAVLLYSLRQMLSLAQALERSEDTAMLPPLIEKLTEAARQFLWDGERRVFVSGAARQVSWASQAWMVLAGALSPSEGAAVFGELARMPDAIKPAGPYLYHYVVESMLTCGLTEQAKALLRDYWGGMIARGATTFWEVYDPADPFLSPYNSHLVNSYCHAWSCTPTYFLRKFPQMFLPG